MSLRSLQGDVPPPEHLKSRIVRDLRVRGMLRSPRRWSMAIAAAVAGLSLFGGGYLWGRATRATPNVSSAPHYALLLYEDSGFDRSQPESALVAEYNAWAGGLAQAGQLVGGEKLGTSVGVEPAPADALGDFSGFFIVAVPNDSAARALARESPHIRHGGRVVVRRIDPT